MTKTQEIQLLGQMLTATTIEDESRPSAIIARLSEINTL